MDRDNLIKDNLDDDGIAQTHPICSTHTQQSAPVYLTPQHIVHYVILWHMCTQALCPHGQNWSKIVPAWCTVTALQWNLCNQTGPI